MLIPRLVPLHSLASDSVLERQVKGKLTVIGFLSPENNNHLIDRTWKRNANQEESEQIMHSDWKSLHMLVYVPSGINVTAVTLCHPSSSPPSTCNITSHSPLFTLLLSSLTSFFPLSSSSTPFLCKSPLKPSMHFTSLFCLPLSVLVAPFSWQGKQVCVMAHLILMLLV